MAGGGRRDHYQLSNTFYQADGNGVRLVLRVTPRARRSQIAGPVEAGEGRTALAVKLAVPPAEGAANDALIALLAKELGVAKSALRIVSGEKSRLKTLRISDCPLPAIAAWASRWTA
jgi:uncharacterized protein